MKIFLTVFISFLLTSPVFSEDFENLYDEATLENESVEANDTGEEPIVTEETNTEISTQNFYNLEIIKGSQSAFDKFVPITVRITPNETPVKTQITWDVPDDVRIRVNHPEFINSMIKGETYEYKVRIKPNDPGIYEIAVNVTAWQHETNYTSSETIRLEFNDNLVIDPNDSNYQIFNILKIILIIITIGGAAVGIYFSGKKLLTFLSDYLKPPDL